MTEPRLCGRCGAPVLVGAHGCSYKSSLLDAKNAVEALEKQLGLG